MFSCEIKVRRNRELDGRKKMRKKKKKKQSKEEKERERIETTKRKVFLQ